MNHPSKIELASFLDLSADAPEYADLRAHILTCSQCAQQVALLRADAGRIERALELSLPRTARPIQVPGRTWQRSMTALQMAMLAGLVTVVLALVWWLAPELQTAQQRGHLYVTDGAGGQLLVLNAQDGTRLGSIAVGERANEIVYDQRRERLYVGIRDGVVVIDPQRALIVQQWQAPLERNGRTGMALDQQRGRLFVALPGSVVMLSLDGPELKEIGRFFVGPAPADLVLSADGRTLYVADQQEYTIWHVDPGSGAAFARLLDRQDVTRHVLSLGDNNLYALSAGAAGSMPPKLWRLDPDTLEPGASISLEDDIPSWDSLVLPNGVLAIARGDGYRGGVTLVDMQSLKIIKIIDSEHDVHALAAGPADQLIAMNWLHSSIRSYRMTDGSVLWQQTMPGVQPYNAVFVP